jgi:hypothetical protein
MREKTMSGEESPYEEHWEEILEYCERCCGDCPPSEMCPGCDCNCIDEEEEGWIDSDDCLDGFGELCE